VCTAFPTAEALSCTTAPAYLTNASDELTSSCRTVGKCCSSQGLCGIQDIDSRCCKHWNFGLGVSSPQFPICQADPTFHCCFVDDGGNVAADLPAADIDCCRGARGRYALEAVPCNQTCAVNSDCPTANTTCGATCTALSVCEPNIGRCSLAQSVRCNDDADCGQDNGACVCPDETVACCTLCRTVDTEIDYAVCSMLLVDDCASEFGAQVRCLPNVVSTTLDFRGGVFAPDAPDAQNGTCAPNTCDGTNATTRACNAASACDDSAPELWVDQADVLPAGQCQSLSKCCTSGGHCALEGVDADCCARAGYNVSTSANSSSPGVCNSTGLFCCFGALGADGFSANADPGCCEATGGAWIMEPSGCGDLCTVAEDCTEFNTTCGARCDDLFGCQAIIGTCSRAQAKTCSDTSECGPGNGECVCADAPVACCTACYSIVLPGEVDTTCSILPMQDCVPSGNTECSSSSSFASAVYNPIFNATCAETDCAQLSADKLTGDGVGAPELPASGAVTTTTSAASMDGLSAYRALADENRTLSIVIMIFAATIALYIIVFCVGALARGRRRTETLAATLSQAHYVSVGAGISRRAGRRMDF